MLIAAIMTWRSTLVCLLVVGISFAQAVRIKIKLPQDEAFHREYQAHRMRRQVQSSCEDVIEIPKSNITLQGRLNQLNDRVKFYRSQHAREGLEFLQTRQVPGLGGQTVADVFQVLRREECFPFVIGGSVRDQFLGRTPRDVDAEIDCPIEDIVEICQRVWGASNCRRSPGSPVGHIGNTAVPGPGEGEDDIDYASTDSVFYVPLSRLEYTVNMMAYDTNGNDVILDITGTGQMDACNRIVRIPSDDDSEASWDEWRVNGVEGGSTDIKKLYRFWKLREKNLQPFNEATREFIVRFSKVGIESKPDGFSDFYCDEVFDVDFENGRCLVNEELCEDGLENAFDYDRAFEEDFGDFWEDVIVPDVLPAHPCDLCQLPSDTGPCRASIPRYFFNSTSGKCEQFTYGGCDGNQNNFEGVELCQQSCNPNDCPPYCTVEYCSARATRRALCTIPSKEASCDGSPCRMTFCHACYYSDDVRGNPKCDTCGHNPQTNVKCFRRWAVCTRRANFADYGNARRRERTQERFKCYEHPCVE